jgi:hypothetical protein
MMQQLDEVFHLDGDRAVSPAPGPQPEPAVAALLARSHDLGADPTVTNYGGGNHVDQGGAGRPRHRGARRRPVREGLGRRPSARSTGAGLAASTSARVRALQGR